LIDLKEMIQRQQLGVQLIEQLVPDEKAVLQHYCSMAAEGLIDLAKKRNAPTNELVINAMKNGVALGLLLIFEDGQVK
jgi:hypothetical protein